ncbi:hypothetical protein ACJDT4_19890 [Clostridium neuense]|uniref:Uncharacterized protein n=1 Tax=Clostridium neuense TaxID=1728934 RepID=A0ABW8TMC2_9CLOT
MRIVEFLKKSLEGRGVYPIFMTIFSWSYAAVLFVALICEFFLYIFKVKYRNPEFKNSEKKHKKGSEKDA